MHFWKDFWKDDQGQDLVEYALMAGFVALAAGAIMPGIIDSIGVIFAKVACATEGGKWIANACAGGK